MLQWLNANLGTLLVGLCLLMIVAFILRKLWRDKKKGKPPGCAGCDGCTGCNNGSGCPYGQDR